MSSPILLQFTNNNRMVQIKDSIGQNWRQPTIATLLMTCLRTNDHGGRSHGQPMRLCPAILGSLLRM